MAIIDASGTTISMDGTAIGHVASITDLGSGTASERDRTELVDTDAKQFGVGLADEGTFSMDLVAVDMADQGQLKLWAARRTRLIHTFLITFPGQSPITVTGFVQQFVFSAASDSDLKASIRVRISGPITGVPAPS